MSSNFVRFQEILNQAFAENFICLTQKLANPPLKSSSSFPNRDPLLEKYCGPSKRLLYLSSENSILQNSFDERYEIFLKNIYE